MYRKCAVTLRDFPDLSAGSRLIRGCNDFSHVERDEPRCRNAEAQPPSNLGRRSNWSSLIWTRLFPDRFLSFCLSAPPTGQHRGLRGQPVGDLLPGERGGDPGPERSLPGAAQGVGEARSRRRRSVRTPAQCGRSRNPPACVALSPALDN